MKKKKLASRKRKKLTAKQKQDQKTHGLSSSISLLKQSFWFFVKHARPLMGLAVIYGVVYYILVTSNHRISVEELETQVNDSFGEESKYATLALAGVAASSNPQSGEVTGMYSFIILTVFSLAFIWMIRRLFVGKQFDVRDALYSGMTPLIPFIAILLLIVLQILPFFGGALLFSFAIFGGAAASIWEQGIFMIVWIALSAIGGYLLSVSVMSIYAVTLPGMRPMQALRAVKKASTFRRWHVLSRIIVLSLVLFAAFSVVLVGVVFTVPSIAFITIDVFTLFALPFTHIYLFHLYKELLK